VTEIVDTRTAGVCKPRTSSREEASELIVFGAKQQIFFIDFYSFIFQV
jgi:hypothetical protein